MKKVIYGVLAATMMLNAGMAAARTHDSHQGSRGNFVMTKCNGTLDNLESTKSIAKYCSRILPKQGIISEHGGAGKTWAEAFPDAWLVNPNDNDKTGSLQERDVMLGHSNGKFKWQYWATGGTTYTGYQYGPHWKEVPRTKEIADKNIVNYVLTSNGGISPNAMTNSAKAQYKVELGKYFIKQAEDLNKASRNAKKNELKEKMYNECVLDMGVVGFFGANEVICNAFHI